MNNIVVEEYGKNDRTEVINLLMRTFPETSSEATFHWRFESPDQHTPLLVCAKDGGRVISFNAWIPWKFSFHGKTLIGYQSGESATDLNYQGKGIWGKLIKVGKELAKKNNADFLFGFPSPPSYNVACRDGYTAITTLYFYLRPLNPLWRESAQFIVSGEFTDYESVLCQEDRITPTFTDKYVRWRYLNNTKSYDLLTYSEDNTKAMFVVRLRKWRGINEALLLDCQFGSYEDNFIRNAFKCLDRQYARKAAWMRTFFVDSKNRSSFFRTVFRIKVTPKSEILMVQPLSDRVARDVLLNFNNWNIMPHCVDSY